jgi:hypothetical protein
VERGIDINGKQSPRDFPAKTRRSHIISWNKIAAPTHAGIWDAGNFVRLKHLPLRWKHALARLVGLLETGES